jgi:hypothetical protein
MKNLIVVALIVLVAIFIFYQLDPTFLGLFPYGYSDGFTNAHGNKMPGSSDTSGSAVKKQNSNGAHSSSSKPNASTPHTTQPFVDAPKNKEKGEGFADLSAYEGPASFSNAEQPAGCYPRDQLTPSELMPKDTESIWAQQNPMGPGSLKGKNFLSAGALIGVNTVGQSLRNANLQVRSEPPNPQMAVSIFNQSTISPDISHRPLEIGA